MKKRLVYCALGLMFAWTGLLAQAPPALTVQVVDKGWFPLPGLVVAVTPVSGCDRSQKTLGSEGQTHTDRNGFAKFAVPNGKAYRIELKKQGGFEEKRACVLVGRQDPPGEAFVQLQTDVAGPFITIQ
jgi:hypothetical protein